MLRSIRSGALRVAALLLAGGLAACSDAPTAVAPSAETAAPALTSYPAPSVSVSNSGGTPLVSWNALSGATGYAVSLIIIETQTNRQTAEGTTWTDEYPLGSTSGTSYLDSSNAYSGDHNCLYQAYPIVTRIMYRYRVTATFSGGTSSTTVNAPIAFC